MLPPGVKPEIGSVPEEAIQQLVDTAGVRVAEDLDLELMFADKRAAEFLCKG